MTLKEAMMKNVLLFSNPELYKKVFPEDLVKKPKEGEDEEYIVPHTPDDLRKAYSEFERRGLIHPLDEEEVTTSNEPFDLIRTYDKIARDLAGESDISDSNIDSALLQALRQGVPDAEIVDMRQEHAQGLQRT